MDEFSKRLGSVETAVADVRVQVAAIAAVLPHLATKADLKEDVQSVRTEVQSLRADMHSMETRMIRWFVGTAATLTTLASGIAFGIAKLIS